MNTPPTRSSLTPTRHSARLRSWLRRAAAATVGALLSGTPFWAFPQANPTSVPVIVADFNHDGLPDALVLAAGNAASATIAFGTLPYGTFSTPRAVAFPTVCSTLPTDPGNSGYLSTGDFNKDGFPDILFTCGTGSGFRTGVMLGVGDGTFAAPVTLTTQPTNGSVLGDFDHDGTLDVVTLVQLYNPTTGVNTPTLYFFHGNGDGTFANQVSTPLGTSATFQPNGLLGLSALTATDVNGDGYPDLVLLASFGGSSTSANGATQTLNVFGNRQDGTFGSASGTSAARLPDATANLGTYNNGASGSIYFANIVAGSFAAVGSRDFVLANRVAPGGIVLVKNTSSSTTYSLAAPVTTQTASVTLAALAANVTGNPVSDLLVSSSTTVSVLANDGAGNFSAAYPNLSVTLPSASTTPLFAVADSNGDGYSDIYTAASDTALHLSVALVNGSATATSQPFTLPAGTAPIGAAWTGNTLFAGSSVTGSETVSALAAPVTLTWPTPAPIPYGTPLSSTQLDAVATDATGAAVPGTFVYTPAVGTVLGAGTQTLSVTFTPNNTTAYSSATATVPLTVTAGSAAITLAVTSGSSPVTTVASSTVVTLTAAVTVNGSPLSAGLVRFCDGSATACASPYFTAANAHVVGTAQLTANGTAVLRFKPAPGTHSYQAVFAGTQNAVAMASAASPLAVTAALPTTTTLTQSGAPGSYTLTATVAGTGSTAPTGTVSFNDTTYGNASLGTATVGSPTVALTQRQSSNPSSGIEPESTATADFNNDGIADIVTLNPSQYHGVTGTGILTVLLGNGDGTFTPATSPSIPGADAALATGDFNGDGNADIVVLNDNGSPTVLLGNGRGGFNAAPATPQLFGTPVAVQVGDFNDDGIADLAVSMSSEGALTNILLGNGDGTFTLASQPQGVPTGVVRVAADVNGDGKLDLITTVEPGNGTVFSIAVLLGNGDGTFTGASQIPFTATAYTSIVSADFNSDGKPDLIAATAGDGQITFTPYTGNGDGTFAAGTAFNIADTTNTLAVATADFNNDGRSDIALSDDAFTRILLNNGDGTFTPAASTPVAATGGPDQQASAVADYNGDGIPDIATANTDLNTVAVLLTRFTSSAVATATSISPVGGGAHQAVASYPGDALYAASTSPAVTLTGIALNPVLTWTPAVSSIVYGTPLGAAQLNAAAATATGAPLAGTFTYTPAAGTVLSAGRQTLSVLFTPTDARYGAATLTAAILVTPAAPTLAWTTPAAIAYGTALGTAQLNATATGVGAVALPGTFTYTPAAGTILAPGAQTLHVSFTPTDAVDYTSAVASVTLTVTAPSLAALTPSTIALGSTATTVTLTGSGFVPNSVARANGAALATTYVDGTTLTASLPASYFLTTGTLSLTVLDPDINATTNAQTLTVGTATPSVTLTGPLATQPGSQPTVALTVTNPFPLPLTATFSLSFTATGGSGVDDPAIQFAAGGRTLSLSIPANSVVVPPIQLQAGTDAGTITIPVVLTAGGANVTPAGLGPLVITVPAAVPALATATLTRGDGNFSVAIHGYSNTREVTTAKFHFVAAPGATINTPDITADVTSVFNGWFGSTASQAFGSTFTYTQVFNSDNPASIQSVEVTLTNSVGVSLMSNAQ